MIENKKKLIHDIITNLQYSPTVIQKEIEKIGCMDFKIRGISPILAFIYNTKTINEELFEKCLKRTSNKTLLNKHNGGNVLFHAFQNNQIEYISKLLKNKELADSINCNYWVDKLYSNPERLYLLQIIETPHLAEILWKLPESVYKNDCKKVSEILMELQKQTDINVLLDSDSRFLFTLIGDDAESVEMVEVFFQFYRHE